MYKVLSTLVLSDVGNSSRRQLQGEGSVNAYVMETAGLAMNLQTMAIRHTPAIQTSMAREESCYRGAQDRYCETKGLVHLVRRRLIASVPTRTADAIVTVVTAKGTMLTTTASAPMTTITECAMEAMAATVATTAGPTMPTMTAKLPMRYATIVEHLLSNELRHGLTEDC